LLRKVSQSLSLQETDPNLVTCNTILLLQLRFNNDDERLILIDPANSLAHCPSHTPEALGGDFSFNLALQRFKDYKFWTARGTENDAAHHLAGAVGSVPYEAEASAFYFRQGFYVAILVAPGYVLRHIGEKRHINNPDDTPAHR
jgi:hypothetical protein